MARGRCKIISLLIAFVMLMLSVFSFTAVPAFAETKTAEIFKLENASNMALTLYYDVEEPTVTIISPSGKALTEKDFTVQRGDKAVCYYIPNAAAGQWSIEYDKKNNAVLDVNWAPYANSLSIESFGFTEDGDYLDAIFKVTSNAKGSYNYALYAAVLDKNGAVSGKKELSNGNAKIDEEKTLRINKNNLNSYSNYHLYIEVWRSEYGIEAGSSAISDASFKVVRENSGDIIENVDVLVNFTKSTVLIDWKNYAVRCDEYIIGIFDAANDAEPIYANAFKKDVNQTEISFTKEIEKIRIELSYVRNGEVSETLKKEVPLKTGVEFTLPTEELTSSKQILISYNSSEKISATVKVNEKNEEISVEGSGSFSIQLDDFDNEIEIKYSLDDEKTVYVNSYRITLDTAAPILLLPENDVTLFVETETFNLAGATEADCILTVNDTIVSVNADGTFLYTLSLSDGENEFVVKSADKAGNATTQTIVIKKVKSAAAVGNKNNNGTGFNFLPLILSFVGSALVAAAAIILNIFYKKNKASSTKYAVICLIRNIALVLSIVSLLGLGYVIFEYFRLDGIIKSEKLFDITDSSISEAYEIISNHDLLGKIMFIGIIAVTVLIVVFIAALLISLRFKRNGNALEGGASEAEKKSKEKKKRGKKPEKTAENENKAAENGEAENDIPVIPEENSVQQPTASAEPEKPKSCFCPYCGTENDISFVFCKNCGKKIN